MSKQPPHYVPGQESQNPNPPRPMRAQICETKPHQIERTPQACIHLYNPPVSTGGVPPRPKKRKTNPISVRLTIKNAKRTQSTPTPACPTTQKCETNPIFAYQASRQPRFLRNEPNPTNYELPTTDYLYETNPILPHGYPAPHQKCETNPI